MLDQEIVEHLIKCSEKVTRAEKEYATAKRNYDVERAKLTCFADWETLLGKSKPTQKEKDSAVVLMTEESRKNVEELKAKLDYFKEIRDINKMQYKN